VLVRQEKAIVMVHLDIIQVHQAMVAVVPCVIMLPHGLAIVLGLMIIFQLIMVAMIELARMIFDPIQDIIMMIDEIMVMVLNMMHQFMGVLVVMDN
jgi:hypothetical protein